MSEDYKLVRNVRDLRDALAGVADEMPVQAIYDSGFGGGDAHVSVEPDRSGVVTFWIDADQG